MAAVSPPEVRRIAAIGSPVLRNLEITYAYSLLAADVARRTGQGANWCTFATWASRQAGATIRGEDALDLLTDRLGGRGGAGCARRELVHVRDVGVASGGADDPRGGFRAGGG
jgi:hypothetical protein